MEGHLTPSHLTWGLVTSQSKSVHWYGSAVLSWRPLQQMAPACMGGMDEARDSRKQGLLYRDKDITGRGIG